MGRHEDCANVKTQRLVRLVNLSLSSTNETVADLRIDLLGLPRLVRIGNEPHILERRDAALLALLVVQGPTARHQAAALLWPDVGRAPAGRNLRQRLFRLRRTAGRDLAVGDSTLELADGVAHDLASFASPAAGDALAAPGELLGGLDYGDCGDLGDWVAATREQWRVARRQALADAAQRFESDGRVAQALPLAERLVLDHAGGTVPEPLSLTVHSVSAPSLADPAQAERGRTFSGRVKMLLVLLVCAAPVIASYFTYFVIRPDGRTNYGTLIVPTRSLPTLALRTLDGAEVAPRSLRGQWLLVAVGPSTCDAACQQRLFMQRQLREMLGRERDRLDKVWFITDSGALAPQWRGALEGGAPVQALRAEREALARWLEPAAGQALEDHLYLVDPMGEWMLRLPARPEPARVKRDLERLLRASSSWDLPGR